MRLWHYKLIPVLPNAMLVSQWRECIAIKRQWEKGTLKHRLVSYVMKYPKCDFLAYVNQVVSELQKRNIKYQQKYVNELVAFTNGWINLDKDFHYDEHNYRYLIQCLYNFQEKYDRGIISKEEWDKIEKAEIFLFNGEGGFTHV